MTKIRGQQLEFTCWVQRRHTLRGSKLFLNCLFGGWKNKLAFVVLPGINY